MIAIAAGATGDAHADAERSPDGAITPLAPSPASWIDSFAWPTPLTIAAIVILSPGRAAVG